MRGKQGAGTKSFGTERFVYMAAYEIEKCPKIAISLERDNLNLSGLQDGSFNNVSYF